MATENCSSRRKGTSKSTTRSYFRPSSPLISILLATCVLLFLSLGISTFAYGRESMNFTFMFTTSKKSLSFFDTWQASFKDYSMLESSPMGDILPDVLNGMGKWQNPVNCSAASYFIFHYKTSYGFGAHVVHWVKLFHVALRTKRVFLFEDDHAQFWMSQCNDKEKDGRHECYFQTMSRTCPFIKVKELVREGALTRYDVDGPNMVDLEGLPVVPIADDRRPSAVFFSQPRLAYSAWQHMIDIYRYQKDFPEIIEDLVQDLKPEVARKYLEPLDNARRTWNSCASFYLTRLRDEIAADIRKKLEVLIQVPSFDMSRVIGLPLRGSDKCFGNKIEGPGEMSCVSLSKAMEEAHRIAYGQPMLTHIIITSEDRQAISVDRINDAQGKIPFHDPLMVIKNSFDDPPGTGNVWMRKGLKTNATFGEMMESSLLSLHLQALASNHVLTPRSTFHSLINAIARTTPQKMTHTMFPLGDTKDLANCVNHQII